MGLFNFRKKEKKSRFPITKFDREWVIENLKWLVQVYGYPQSGERQIVFSEEFFAMSTKNDGGTVENLIADLKSILNLQHAEVTFDFQDDIRDIEG